MAGILDFGPLMAATGQDSGSPDRHPTCCSEAGPSLNEMTQTSFSEPLPVATPSSNTQRFDVKDANGKDQLFSRRATNCSAFGNPDRLGGSDRSRFGYPARHCHRRQRWPLLGGIGFSARAQHSLGTQALGAPTPS